MHIAITKGAVVDKIEITRKDGTRAEAHRLFAASF